MRRSGNFLNTLTTLRKIALDDSSWWETYHLRMMIASMCHFFAKNIVYQSTIPDFIGRQMYWKRKSEFPSYSPSVASLCVRGGAFMVWFPNVMSSLIPRHLAKYARHSAAA